MHIPDGYLGPQTYSALYGLMAPIWWVASRRLKKTLHSRRVSLLALGAAFTFVAMMFNVPAPGGTTGHAVGGTLLAIVLGPWPSVVAITIALAVQALLFGDGGITTLGANCFNMAFALPFAGYAVYRLISAGSGVASPRRWIAAGIAGYVSLNLAALLTAVELGLQPILAHSPDGRPLYAPFPLTVTVPVMAFLHLVFFGPVEGIVTALVVAYLGREDPSLLEIPGREVWALDKREMA